MVDFAFATAAWIFGRRARSLRLYAGFLATLAVLVASPVSAADPSDGADLRKAEAAATEAKVFFKAGLFDKASGKFMEAYAISKRPSLMYNAARAYEEGLNFREAVALLKHYRDLPDVGIDGKRDADERIARMEGVLRQQADDEAKKQEAARVESARMAAELKKKLDAERAERERLERERIAQLPVEPTPSGAPSRARKVSWALVATAVGTGILAAGAYGEALYEANQARQMTITDDNDVTSYLGHVSDAKTFQTVAIVGAVLSAGAAGWALADWWTSGANGAEKSPPKTSVSVFPAAGGGMLSLRGSF